MELYEESMPIMTQEHDYSIYFISESMPVFEKINLIIKKGQPFQKEHLLSNMEVYINNTSIFPSLLHFITNEIDMWDSSLQIAFSRGLYKSIVYLLRDPLNGYSSKITLLAIKCFQKAIATYEEKVSNEYSVILSNLILFLTKKPVRLKLSNEIVQFASSLGKFGQDVKNRRLSVFLCCSLLKISNEFNDILFKRIMMLSSDVECIVKRQMAYELTDLIKIVPFEHLRELIASVIDIPLSNNNNDIVSYGEAVCAIADNMKVCLSIQYKVSYNFILNAFNKLFNEENDFELIKKPFIYLMKLINSKFNNEELFALHKPARTFITLFYLNSLWHIGFFMEYFDHMVDIFANDVMFLKIVLERLNDVIPSLGDESKQLFYSNLHKIIWKLPIGVINDLRWEIILIKQNLPLIVNQNFNLIIYSSIDKKLNSVIKIILDDVGSIQLSTLKPHFIEAYITGLKQTIKFIYYNGEYLKNREDIYKKFISISKQLITGSKGFLIQSLGIRLIPLLLKYSIERDKLNTYIDTSIMKSVSFYTRRLFAPFIYECIEVLSVNYLIKLNIIDNLTEMIQKEKVANLRIKAIQAFSSIMAVLKNNKALTHYITIMKEIKAISTTDVETNKALSALAGLIDKEESSSLADRLANEEKKRREEDKILKKDNSPKYQNTFNQLIAQNQSLSRGKLSRPLPPVILNHSVNQTTTAKQIDGNISFNINNYNQLKPLPHKQTSINFFKQRENPNGWNPIICKEMNNRILKIPTIKLTPNKVSSLKPFVKYEAINQSKKVSSNISLTSSYYK